MKQSIADRLTLFSDNSQAARTAFRWSGGGSQQGRLISLIYALEGKSLDPAAVRNAHDIIKDKTGMFSKFRGITSLCVAAKLSLNNDPQQLFTDTLAAHDRLRQAKFPNSDQLAIAAFLVASGTERHNFKKTADRAMQFSNGMKNRLRFLAGQDNSILAAMLGLSNMIPSVGIERIEQLYQQLKPELRRAGSNSVETLSQILALGGTSDEALDCLLSLNQTLRAQRIRLDKQFTLPALGTLSLLSVDATTLADDILEAQSYLRTQRGLRTLSGQELLLFTTAIISSVYIEECMDSADNAVLATASASIVNIIIAQQIMMMIIIMAAASSAAAASA
ncbi:MAG: DUF4003 domain-containing protein [Coriobacteriia bacterium]|nr:DUF4003 domain-containing protein [Coriobacteriia bacterium]